MKTCFDHPYRGRTAALLTQHGKERVIGPVLDALLGCRVEHVQGYDTDLLGTFTREIPRGGTQLEAARRKARQGMALSGLPLGIASEGAFGPDPIIGLCPWNVEVIVWIDDLSGVEVLGRAQGKANFAHARVADWSAVEGFARQWLFPAHFLVVRPESQDDPRIHKGICSWSELETAFVQALEHSSNGVVFLETDVRAHANPSRQHHIRLAAEDLAARLRSPCPACDAPGFWVVERVAGLPCEGCGAPTDEPVGDVLGCVRCTHRVLRERAGGQLADPGRCDHCNP